MNIHGDTNKGAWNEIKGEARKSWGKLTDDKLEEVKGESERLAGLLQKQYGMSIEQARDEIDKMVERYDDVAHRGDWNVMKGKIRETWGELTEDEIEKTAGRRSQLVGLIEKKYGESRSNAWMKVNEFVGRNF